MLVLFLFCFILAAIIASYPPSAPYVLLFEFAVVTYVALKDESWGHRIGAAFFFIIYACVCFA